MLHVVRKLQGRSAAEVHERLAQRLAILAERAGWRDAGEPSDHVLLRRLRPDVAAQGLAALVVAVRDRARPPFFPGMDDPIATARVVRQRWPSRQSEIVHAADEVLAGRFSLLGHGPLYFGAPVQWSLDPVLGVHAPSAHWSTFDYLDPSVAGDHKLVWELNRHQYLVTLGQAFALTHDEKYAARAVELLTQWMDANPPKHGVNWASSLEVAYRSIAWLWALRFLRQAQSLHVAFVVRWLKYFEVAARHLERYLSTYFSPNTHLTGEALGLLYIGTQLPELQAAPRWTALGWRLLTGQLQRQIRADGSYFEQATYYHRYTCDIYCHARVLGAAHGLPGVEQVDDAIARLAAFLMWTSRADGTMPLFGDEDGGRLLFLDSRACDDVRSPLATAAVLLGEGPIAAAAGEPSDELAWLLGDTGLSAFDRVAKAPPTATAHAFGSGGFFTMRDGWSAQSAVLTVDCGPLGADNGGHAHADTLAFDLAIGRCPVFVDAGTVSYTTSVSERDTMRSSLVHNTLSLDGISSSESAGPFRWRRMTMGVLDAWHATPAGAYFEGHHDGYATLDHPARHRRLVLAARHGWWLVRDVIESAGDHDALVTFQCASGLDVDVHDDVVRVSDDGRLVASVRALDSPGAWQIDQGVASRRYGARESAARARYAVRTRGNSEIIFVITRGDGAPVAITREQQDARAAVRLTSAEFDDLVLFDPEAKASVDGVRTNARVAWLRGRGSDGMVESLLTIGGTVVELDGARVADPAGGVVSAVREGGEWRVVRAETPVARAATPAARAEVRDAPTAGQQP